MKVIAFYLPQFHRIPENDKWWGKGFTEWTNTRKASSRFTQHYQPREPYQSYYYDLSDSSARKWQAELAKQYGIYGFCYYHYWFKGKQLLETPFNEVLRTGEPDLPFCLSWANEPWTRRWDGLSGHVLMPQDYGDEQDWKLHFDYLLKAFKDERYIRIDNKPVFIIYQPGGIPQCEAMLQYWNQLAIANGLDGIYFVETLNGFPIPNVKGFDASVEFEPHYTWIHGGCQDIWKVIKDYQEQDIWVIDYDKLYTSLLSRNPPKTNKQVIPGAFVDWDNTPRLGNNALIFQSASPEKFTNYLSQQILRARTLYNSDFVFINAWNEWGEGAYLEPDSRYGFQYLEAVKKALKVNGISNPHK
ncbi:glycoside hydrolase family 99-like domain-containing protein [Bacillus nitratireducens]|uniref:glycosyltransferase WbsX family protein n=1 Tax=Bacillus nitratireducens TaxID=2026193 RepID=UPI001BA81F4B|nr:glycoside hydrolase family 99-like domain-containing protein [Bacillus nitratireducens]QUG87016.1 glycosyl transferase [Bacillus nitratireducens]